MLETKKFYKIFADGEKFPLIDEFYTIQGEGYHVGKAAYFLRFGGCDIGCRWCDSKLAWTPNIHKLITIDQIINNIKSHQAKDVVVTGGEPLKYPMDKLCEALHLNDIGTYLETSGSYPFSGQWDWICLSPKKKFPPLSEIYNKANELKVIIYNLEEDLCWAEKVSEKVNVNCQLFLQPEWSHRNINTPEIVAYIKKNTKWKLSLQAHKYINIP